MLSCILDPLLQLCTVSASNLGTADMASYMVNSLYVMKTTLALFEFTDKRLEMLEFQVGPPTSPHLTTPLNSPQRVKNEPGSDVFSKDLFAFNYSSSRA